MSKLWGQFAVNDPHEGGPVSFHLECDLKHQMKRQKKHFIRPANYLKEREIADQVFHLPYSGAI